MELSDIAVRNLVPEPLRDVESVPEFMEKLPEYDSDISSLVEEADAAGECLRFVGKLTPAAHPFPSTLSISFHANLQGLLGRTLSVHCKPIKLKQNLSVLSFNMISMVRNI